MKIDSKTTDAAVLRELGERLSKARLDRNLSQQDLAVAAGVSKRTIERLESGSSIQLANLVRMLRTLNLSQNLDQLCPEATASPIQQLRLRGKSRRRASPHGAAEAKIQRPWTWDDNKK